MRSRFLLLCVLPVALPLMAFRQSPLGWIHNLVVDIQANLIMFVG